MSNKLPEAGFVRISDILGDPRARPPVQPLIPISRTTWWQGIKDGRFPTPVKLFGPKIAAWRVSDIRRLIDIDSSAGKEESP